MKIYKVKNKLWRWPGGAGWHFMYVDKKLSEEIKKISKGYRYGSGFVAIKAKVGKTSWDTALFPHTKEGVYLISIKESIRKKEEILEGDILDVGFSFRKI